MKKEDGRWLWKRDTEPCIALECTKCGTEAQMKDFAIYLYPVSIFLELIPYVGGHVLCWWAAVDG